MAFFPPIFSFFLYSRLVNVNVSGDLRKELTQNQYLLTGTLGIQPGQSLLLLNGILLSPSVDIFALLDVIRQEAKMMAQLHALGIPVSIKYLVIYFIICFLYIIT
ncbi:unnamed protein product [Trichobilharzia regenti]|nr:unnamed protein product [Trichobilharzia regenti]